MAAATRSARLLVAPVNESGALPNRCGRTPLSLNLASPPKVDKRIISGAGVRVIGTGGGLGSGRAPGRGRCRAQRDRGGGGGRGAGGGGGGGRGWGGGGRGGEGGGGGWAIGCYGRG